VPLPVPHLVAAAGLVMLLTQSGIAARLAYAGGLIGQPSDFPPLFYDRSSVGIVLVYLWKEVPFIGLVLLAVLKSTGSEYEEAAATLGASPLQRLRYVLLPLLLPSLLATSVIVFAYMFGSFEIPLLLGARYPEVLPVMAYRLYSNPDLSLRPQAMVVGVLTTVILVGLLAIYRRLARGGVR
jgi:putative spermidine/putrescine transport system permease protein